MFSIIQAAGWPIWPLIACSVLALAIIGERFYSLRRAGIAPSGLTEEAIAASANKAPSTAIIEQLRQNSSLGQVLASGLQTLHDHPNADEAQLRANLEGAGRIASSQMEKYLPALATIASAAPLLGLLGTVIGMIEIFASQGTLDSGVISGNPSQLAHGISIALYNTAFGLIVAIPALIFWRYFRARIDAYVLEMEVASERFVQHLKGLQK